MTYKPEDILARIMDLHKQATIERSHFYVGSTLLACAHEIERLRAILARCGNIAGMCRMEMQGRLADDEHQRAFRALGLIQMNALGCDDDRPVGVSGGIA